MTRALTVAALLVACSENVVIVAPIIDSPPAGSKAYPWPRLERIRLEITLAGDLVPLAAAEFLPGETLDLRDVPYGENLVLRMTGYSGGLQFHAYGQTCAFSIRHDEPPPQPHLYFATTNSWGEAAVPPSAQRSNGTGITLRDGSGLYVGGHDNAIVPVSGVDRFDTINGRFEMVADVTPRRNGAAATLGDGRIVIAGGLDPATGMPIEMLEVLALDAEVEHRVTTAAAGMLHGVSAPPLVTLSDGTIVAIGGADDMNKATNRIIRIRPFESTVIADTSVSELAIPRKNHTATRVSDDLFAPVLIVGGVDDAGALIPTATLYRPLNDSVTPTSQFAPLMKVPRRDHKAARLPDGSVAFIGGLDSTNMPIPAIEVFSSDRGFFTGPVGGEAATEFSVTPLVDRRVLIAGGRDKNNMLVPEVFIVETDRISGGVNVVYTDPMLTARAGHQATLLCDGTVMVTGGTPIAAPAERYNPLADGRR